MRDGYRVVDTDTHVVPAMEVLHDFASEDLVRRWDELGPHLKWNADQLRPDLGDWDKPYSNLVVSPHRYDRPLGGRSPEQGNDRGDAKKTPMAGRLVARAETALETGIWHDNREGRLRAMDLEGVDRHLIIPGTFAMASTALEPSLSRELCSAYNRYITWYCGADADRLKASIQVPATDPTWSAIEIKRLSDERCVAAATVCLPQDMPVDDPALEPIWQAMDDSDLPLLHHSFFYEPPYFPGYRDMWGNVVAARAAAHPWGAQRLVAYLILAGLFDRYPRLRVGFAEVGAGWLPFWLYRLRGQAEYMRSLTSDMKRDPVDYALEGHIYVGLEFYESEALAESIIAVLGEDVLMYQSDFPHPQCKFPHSPAQALSWTSIADSAKRKLLSENADRYLRIV